MERAVELKLAKAIHSKRRSKKNLDGLYEVLAPGSEILKVRPNTSIIKEPGEPIVTVRNSDIAKIGFLQERQTPLKVYADRRGPRTGKKLVEEQIPSDIKQFTRKIKVDKKMKHRKRDPVAEFHPRNQTFHARCERKSLNFLIFAPVGNNNKVKWLFPIASNQILLNLHLPQHWQTQFHRLKHLRTETVAAPMTRLLRIRRQI